MSPNGKFEDQKKSTFPLFYGSEIVNMIEARLEPNEYDVVF